MRKTSYIFSIAVTIILVLMGMFAYNNAEQNNLWLVAWVLTICALGLLVFFIPQHPSSTNAAFHNDNNVQIIVIGCFIIQALLAIVSSGGLSFFAFTIALAAQTFSATIVAYGAKDRD